MIEKLLGKVLYIVELDGLDEFGDCGGVCVIRKDDPLLPEEELFVVVVVDDD